MIVAFDLETTGLDTANDRIVQIAAVKVDEKLCEVDRLVYKVNPGVDIPREATDVHGISNEDVKDCPSFESISDEVVKFFADCDISGFNVMGYDIPLIQEELHRCGKRLEYKRIIDVQELYHHFNPRTLESAVNFYCGRSMENAHDALADVLATIAVLKAQIMRHSEISSFDEAHRISWGNKIDMDGKFVWNKLDEAVFGFGKEKGKPLEACKSFLRWMLKNSFSRETKEIARRAAHGEYPTKDKASS